MYKDDIKILKSEKREALWFVIRDYIVIYLKVMMHEPTDLKKRTDLGLTVRKYIHYNNNESKILNLINKYYSNKEDIEFIDEILDELDSMFIKLYDYYDQIYLGYEDMLLTNNSIYASIPKKDFKVLNNENMEEYIKKLKC